MYKYKTRGSCSTAIDIEMDDTTIKSVRFYNGCQGNTMGVSRLVEGMQIDKAISLLTGIQCRNGTSCPDQLSRALQAIKGGNLKAGA